MPSECPNCEKIFAGKSCRTCGWSSGAAPRTKASDYTGQCHWDTRGRPCRMVGNGKEEGGQWRCEWHGLMARDPRAAESFEEFERFQEAQRLHYCGQFSHAAPGVLWDAVRGDRAAPETTLACSDPSCRLSCPSAAHGKPSQADVRVIIRKLVTAMTV